MWMATKYPNFKGNEPCRSTDPDSFFSDGHFPSLNEQLKRICSSCEMLEPCREYAIRFEDIGFWGGLAPGERRRIRREQGIQIGSELRQSAA